MLPDSTLMTLDTLLDVNLEYAHDATASWNGYIYQGKIAVIVALERILQLGIDNCHAHSLEVEWLDDFAIKNGESYESVHQVKAKGSPIFSAYSTDIGILAAKLLSVFPAYQLVNILGLKGQGTLEEKKQRQKAQHQRVLQFLFDNSFINGSGQFINFSDDNPDFDGLDLPGYSGRQLAEKRNKLAELYVAIRGQVRNYSTIDSAYFHTSSPIEEVWRATVSQPDQWPSNWADNGFSAIPNFLSALNKVTPYSYNDWDATEKFSLTSEEAVAHLSWLIKKLLREVPDKAHLAENVEHVGIVRNCLGAMIEKHVEERRLSPTAPSEDESIPSTNSPTPISFEELLAIVKDPKEDKHYYSYSLWESVRSAVNQQIHSLESQERKDQLTRLIGRIEESYPREKIFHFLQLIRPDISERPDWQKSYANFGNQVHERQWERVFLKFFKEINQKVDHWEFKTTSERNRYYLVSALEMLGMDDPSNHEDEVETVKTNLEKATTSTETFLRDFLIGKFGQGFEKPLKDFLPRDIQPTQEDLANTQGQFPTQDEANGPTTNDRITHPLDVRLIDYRLAITNVNALNDDEIDT